MSDGVQFFDSIVARFASRFGGVSERQFLALVKCCVRPDGPDRFGAWRGRAMYDAPVFDVPAIGGGPTVQSSKSTFSEVDNAQGGEGCGIGRGGSKDGRSSDVGVVKNDACVVRGVNYARNKAARLRKKERKKVDAIGAVGVDFDGLARSQREKWQAQNELAAERAKRDLAILKASDMEMEINKRRVNVRANIERNMVSIEKNHSILRATDNVPYHGDVHTVVESVPGLTESSISPNSSVSLAEVRMQGKRLADLEYKIALVKERKGIDVELIESYDKEVWTDNSENHHILGQIYEDGYGMDTSFQPDGKFRVT